MPETAHAVLDAAGPEILTYAQMMRILAEAAGRSPPWILPVPVLSPKLSAYWLRFVTAVPTNIARALIEGLKHDFNAHPQELRRLVPQRLLGFGNPSPPPSRPNATHRSWPAGPREPSTCARAASTTLQCQDRCHLPVGDFM